MSLPSTSCGDAMCWLFGASCWRVSAWEGRSLALARAPAKLQAEVVSRDRMAPGGPLREVLPRAAGARAPPHSPSAASALRFGLCSQAVARASAWATARMAALAVFAPPCEWVAACSPGRCSRRAKVDICSETVSPTGMGVEVVGESRRGWTRHGIRSHGREGGGAWYLRGAGAGRVE